MQDPQKRIAMCPFATIGATTARGGQVTLVSSAAEICDKGIALVGDAVTYDDGTQARIIDGAGFRMMWCDKPGALVGSRLDNGDKIIATPHNNHGITVVDRETVPGLFDPTWTPGKGQGGEQTEGSHG